MWPSQDQANRLWSKWELIQNLDLVAGSRTFTARPKTRLLVDGENLTDRMVLKRTHSDAGEHVLVPRDAKSAHKRNWEYLRTQLDIPGALWMAQGYQELLLKKGEWRVFLVGGQIVYTIHTIRNRDKGTWSCDIVRTYYSLDELTYV